MIVQAQLGGGSGSVIGQFAWLLAGNDTAGVTKILGTTSNDDVAVTTNNTTRGTWFKSGEWGIGITASPLGTLHVKGASGQSPLYVINNAGTSSFEVRDNGQIYRNGILYSVDNTAGLINTSWGYQALNSLTSGQNNVGMGNQALKAITTGVGNIGIGTSTLWLNVSGNYNVAIGQNAALSWTGTGNGDIFAIGLQALELNTGTGGNTAVGTQAGQQTTTGYANTYLGNEAAYYNSGTDNQTGYYNTIIGNQARVGGSYNSVIALNGIGTGSNQFVVGGAVHSYTGAVSFVESLNYVYTVGGAKHSTYFRTSTPESNQIGNPGDKAQVNDGTDGEEFIKTVGTGDTGWGQVVAATAVTTEVLVPDTSLTIKINGTTYKILARA